MLDLIKSGNTMDCGKLLELPEKNDRFGMGYKPSDKEVQKTNKKKLCTLQETFHKAGYKREDHVAVVEEETEETLNLMC